MVTPLEGFEKPRGGVKCVRVGCVRWDARMYERDLDGAPGEGRKGRTREFGDVSLLW